MTLGQALATKLNRGCFAAPSGTLASSAGSPLPRRSNPPCLGCCCRHVQGFPQTSPEKRAHFLRVRRLNRRIGRPSPIWSGLSGSIEASPFSFTTMFVRKHGARGLIRRQEPRPLPAGLFFLMRLTDAATVVNIGLQLSAGHRRQSRSEGCCGGARDRDRTLRLPVTRERPRAFLRSLGNGRGSFLSRDGQGTHPSCFCSPTSRRGLAEAHLQLEGYAACV